MNFLVVLNVRGTLLSEEIEDFSLYFQRSL